MAKKQKKLPDRSKNRDAEIELVDDGNRALTKRERRNAARRNESFDEYDYDDEVGVTKASMKKAMRYVIVGCVFLLLSLGILFGSILINKVSVENQKKACWQHQQEVQTLAANYIEQYGFASLPAYVEDIPGFSEIDKDCPSGGEYTWDPVNGRYTCSVHGDVPDGFNQAQSSMTKRTTEITNESKE